MTQSGNWNSMRELPLYHRNGGGTRAERWRMISATWKTIKDVVLSFISDEALTCQQPSRAGGGMLAQQALSL